MSNKVIPGVLCAFSYGCVGGSKRNPTITKEVIDQKHAGDDAGAWSDRLYPKKSCGKRNSFTELRRHLGQMRAYHYSSTFLYEDSLWRILPNKRTEAYKAMVEVEGKKQARELLDVFCADLPNLIDLARLGRGDAFRESDYPTEDEVRDKFYFNVDYRPVPDASALNSEMFQEAIDKLNALHQQRLKEANTALVTRFMEPLKLLAEQLKDTNKRKLAPVLDNIREFAAIVPSLDLSGNTELLEFAQQISLSFANISSEELKKDEELQKLLGNTCTGVVNALSRFGDQGVRKFA